MPKSDGSIRLVLDCSSPRGSSVNDGIEKSEYSVTYAKFDDAVDIVRSLGKGSFMAKLDIKHAFRICPINPLDWGLMGSKFKGKYFIDIRLPFGLRSSPFIFNTVADAFHWILVHKGYIEHSIHYLDDFFFANSTNSLCQIDLENAEYIFDCIKIPLAMDKKEGPSQVITFLGIEIDTSVMVLRLPQDKLRKAKDLISEWVDKSSCSKQDLLSLIGFLSFACKVVKPGRMFLRRLIDLSSQAKELFHFIHINKEAKKDINWWHNFLDSWHGGSVFPESFCEASALQLYSDASFCGIGGFFNGRWFAIPIPLKVPQNITFLEIAAVKACIQVWSTLLMNKQIWINTDNLAVVHIWTKGSCKDPQIMAVVRSLFLLLTTFNINIQFCHVPGKNNYYADLLSRLQISQFLEICPWASPSPDHVPPSVWHTSDV